MNQNFAQIIRLLHGQKRRKRIAVVCPEDEHTEHVIFRCLSEGIADFVLFTIQGQGNSAARISRLYPENTDIIDAATQEEAARMAVSCIRSGKADALMKGTINTDILLRAVIDKEKGLLPQGGILSHVTAAQIPTYHKMILFSDAAVIPVPNLKQMQAILQQTLDICRHLGIGHPYVALIHCNEKTDEKFPHTLIYKQLKQQASEGAYGELQIDGPMDVKTACDRHSGIVKGIHSTVAGNADILIFPNIEAGNTFYKTISLFAGAEMAGMLTGTTAPVILPSRADSDESKYYSIALACLAGGTKTNIPD